MSLVSHEPFKQRSSAMRPLYIRIAVAIACCVASPCALPQSTPIVRGAGYAPPIPLLLAPGQIVTVYVSGLAPTLTPGQRAYAAKTPLPTTLAGISATMTQFSGPTPLPIPLLAVSSFAGCQQELCTLIGVTIQVPFELVPNFPLCLSCTNGAQIVVSDGTRSTPPIDISPVPAQVRILRPYDVLTLIPGFDSSVKWAVIHSDGRFVTSSNPALAGEEIVIYAVGLGAPTSGPPLTLVKSGDVTPSPAPVAAGTLSYDFRINATPSRTLAAMSDPYLRFVGMSPGSVGLYQVNFVVPPLPPDLLECDNVSVSSNLTVTLMGWDSFDGAGICVKSLRP